MAPPLLVLLVLAFLVGTPLLAGAIAVGLWMRRAGKACALKTWLGASASGAVSFLALCGAIAALIGIVLQEKRHPDYFEDHPFVPLLMIALGFLFFAAACICALFCAWTVWRLVEAPPAQPVRTTPAG